MVVWAKEWGLKISVEKTKYMVFGQKRKLGQTLQLYSDPAERMPFLKIFGSVTG